MATERKRNLQSFIQKAATYRVTPSEWFAKNSDYLLQFSGVKEIFSEIHSNKITDENAFNKIIHCLSLELINQISNNVRHSERVNRALAPNNKYTLKIYFSDSNGEEIIREEINFDSFQKADEYAIRKLSDDYCGTRAVIYGLGLMTQTSRNDAIARFWGGRKRKQVMKKVSFGNKLKFIGKAKTSSCSFSKG
jgi:phenylalanyl-tRNA synthetase alpha subunit